MNASTAAITGVNGSKDHEMKTSSFIRSINKFFNKRSLNYLSVLPDRTFLIPARKITIIKVHHPREILMQYNAQCFLLN